MPESWNKRAVEEGDLRRTVTIAGSDLQRKLTRRQLSMLAIGGAIGVGLFLGSNVTIQLAGPGIILSYAIGAIIALIVAHALAEMAVVHPESGSFGVYAENYLNRWAGFTVRATYAVAQIIAIGAEVTAVAIYFAFWFPAIPQWVWVVSASTGLVAINTLQVGHFGEFEYWLALIKLLAIAVFILIGAGLILGVGRTPGLGLSNLTVHGGFLPFGWRGVWLALSLTLTSYMGVEALAVTAGEAERPDESIPSAVRGTVLRLILFYLLAITVMLAVKPWKQASSELTGSPFVQAFASAGIPYAASLMNLVVIAAALSSSNTDLYLVTRMLFSLSRSSHLPAWLGRLTANGVPARALAVSTVGMIAAILLAIYAPARAFLMLYGVAVAGMFFVWVVILVAHLAFRKTIGPQRVASLPMRLPLFPFSTLFGIGALIAIAASTFYVNGLRYTIPGFVPYLFLISLAYLIGKRRKELRKPAKGYA